MSGIQGSLVRGLGWVRQHPKKDQQGRAQEGRPPAIRLPRTWNPWPTTPTAPNPARGSHPAQTWGFRWCPKQTLELYTCVCVCGGECLGTPPPQFCFPSLLFLVPLPKPRPAELASPNPWDDGGGEQRGGGCPHWISPLPRSRHRATALTSWLRILTITLCLGTAIIAIISILLIGKQAYVD